MKNKEEKRELREAKKQEKQEKKLKDSKIKELSLEGAKTLKMGLNRKRIVIMWVILIISFVFAVYKNFTAIDVNTVHETVVEKQEIVDYEGISIFATNFATVYHTIGVDSTANTARSENLSKYMTAESIRIMNSGLEQSQLASSVTAVKIYSVEPTSNENEYDVSYSVVSNVVNGSAVESMSELYKVRIYKNGNKYVVTGLPTVTTGMTKSDYEPKVKAGTVDVKSEDSDKIKELLNTFFKVYLTADKSELERYAKEGVFEPINNTVVVFSNLEDVKYISQKDNKIEVTATVRFLNTKTNLGLMAEYNLVLEKTNSGWIISEYK